MTIAQPKSFTPLYFLGLLATVAGCSSPENAYVPPPPPEITVANPVERMITPFVQENGVIEAVDEAEVRARVRGFVEEIKFAPGQPVKEGDLLYLIERDLYEAAVNSAEAAVASAEASISVAKAMVKTAEAEITKTAQDRTREQLLLERNAGSQADLDAAIAANESAKAAMESAEANVQAAIAEKGRMVASLEKAQLDLNYTEVRSPITGDISITDIKKGNLVEDGAQLAAVVNRQQVFANFSISDRAMLRFMNAKRAKLKRGEELEELDWSTVPVYLQREGDEGYPFQGVLDYVDQEGIDASTGTLGMRAKFRNKFEGLYPGLFVSVRMPTADPAAAMLIPEYAVLRDQRGLYVLAVNAESEVERVSVSISQSISGWSVVKGGLTTDSRVVIDGLQQARPGLKVNATDKPLEVDDEALLRGSSPSGLSVEVGDQSEAESDAPTPSADQ